MSKRVSGPTERGRLIVLEGTDGCGSTTQGDLLAGWLRSRGKEVVRTAQPSDLEVGRLLRQVLRGQVGDGSPPAAATVALLFAADRVDHAARVVQPALERGAWVVCDRHLASSLAFQPADEHGGGVDAGWVWQINARAALADLTLWIDVPVEEALARIAARGKPIERFETAATLARVRDRYAALHAAAPAQLGPFVRVDGTGAREAIACAIRQIVTDLAAGPRGNDEAAR